MAVAEAVEDAVMLRWLSKEQRRRRLSSASEAALQQSTARCSSQVTAETHVWCIASHPARVGWAVLLRPVVSQLWTGRGAGRQITAGAADCSQEHDTRGSSTHHKHTQTRTRRRTRSAATAHSRGTTRNASGRPVGPPVGAAHAHAEQPWTMHNTGASPATRWAGAAVDRASRCASLAVCLLCASFRPLSSALLLSPSPCFGRALRSCWLRCSRSCIPTVPATAASSRSPPSSFLRSLPALIESHRARNCCRSRSSDRADDAPIRPTPLSSDRPDTDTTESHDTRRSLRKG